MDKTLEQELAEAAGESHYRSVRPLELNEVSLNGSGATKQTADGKFEPEGGYFRKRLYVGHRNKNEKPEEVTLGKQIKIIFLRKRRKLVERGADGKIVRATNEHNHPGESVTLYNTVTKQSENGIAKDLRIKYDGVRTVEIIYSLLITDAHEPELIRFTTKGASLGSNAKADTTTDLYKYLGAVPQGKHHWQYYTTLNSVFEQGKMSYFAVDFKLGDELDTEMVTSVVASAMRKVKENIDALDRDRAERIANGITVQPAEKPSVQEGSGIEYPQDEINPDDIPF